MVVRTTYLYLNGATGPPSFKTGGMTLFHRLFHWESMWVSERAIKKWGQNGLQHLPGRNAASGMVPFVSPWGIQPNATEHSLAWAQREVYAFPVSLFFHIPERIASPGCKTSPLSTRHELKIAHQEWTFYPGSQQGIPLNPPSPWNKQNILQISRPSLCVSYAIPTCASSTASLLDGRKPVSGCCPSYCWLLLLPGEGQAPRRNETLVLMFRIFSLLWKRAVVCCCYYQGFVENETGVSWWDFAVKR